MKYSLQKGIYTNLEFGTLSNRFKVIGGRRDK